MEDEKKLVELSVKVGKLEEDTRRSQRYVHVMLEDLITRLAKIETTAARFEENLIHVNGNGNTTTSRLMAIENRLVALERMAWIAIGGMMGLGGVAGFLGWQVLKVLLK